MRAALAAARARRRSMLRRRARLRGVARGRRRRRRRRPRAQRRHRRLLLLLLLRWLLPLLRGRGADRRGRADLLHGLREQRDFEHDDLYPKTTPSLSLSLFSLEAGWCSDSHNTIPTVLSRETARTAREPPSGSDRVSQRTQKNQYLGIFQNEKRTPTANDGFPLDLVDQVPVQPDQTPHLELAVLDALRARAFSYTRAARATRQFSHFFPVAKKCAGARLSRAGRFKHDGGCFFGTPTVFIRSSETSLRQIRPHQPKKTEFSPDAFSKVAPG